MRKETECPQSLCLLLIIRLPLSHLIVLSTSLLVNQGAVIKLAHRRAQDMARTVEVLADGKCFDICNLSFSTSGQLLATIRVDGGVEIWDPIKRECLRTIVCGQLSKLKFSPDGRLLAATSSDGRLCLYTIQGQARCNQTCSPMVLNELRGLKSQFGCSAAR
jgi:WD40 repeat protein